jgi:hypothetical protein
MPQYAVEDVFPPDKYDYIPKVAVFKTHKRVKGGKVVTVTKKELDATASVHNRLFEKFGRFSPFSKGHTLDQGPNGSDVDESEQPDTCGGAFDLFVEPSPDPAEEEYILYCTWAIPKEEKEEVLKQYVSISPEFYPSKNWIYPFSLLKSSAPEIPDMPIIPLRYSTELQTGEEPPYRLVIDSPFRYSQENPMNPMDEKKDDKDTKPKSDEKKADPKPADGKSDDEKAMDKAEKAETRGAKEDQSDLSEIKQMLAELTKYLPLLQQLDGMMNEEMDGEGDDAMKAADDKPAPDTGAPVEKGQDVPPEKDSAKEFNSPVKFDAMGSSTNCFVPSTTDEKGKYKMSDNDLVKYKADLEKTQAELKATAKIAQDLYKKNRKIEAEKLVAEIETVCKYRSDKARSQDLDMLTKLDEESAKQYVEMAKERYERRLPDATGVKEVAKYAVEGDVDLTPKTPEEAHANAMKILQSGLSREEYYKQLATGKKAK